MTEHHDNADRDELVDASQLAALLGDPSTWAEPPAGLEDSVVQAVAVAEPAAPSGRGGRHRRARPAATAPWGRIVLSAAAAVMVVVAGLLVAARGGSTPDFEGELAATELQPGAAASVDASRNDGGFRLSLDVAGLPLLDAGEYYQAWLKNSAGTLVAVGTFSSGDEQVTLWSGVSPADFSILTVTIEATDGDQSSSGRVVLAGELHEP